MSLVPRFIKPVSGTRDYIPDTTILSAQVNKDFNDLYDNYNGGITDANIATGANINGQKLLLLSVDSAQLAPNAVTTTKIDDGAVTTAKLAQNATTPVFAVANANPSLTIVDSPQTVLTLPSVTTRGGRVLLTGTIVLMYRQARNVAVTATLKILENATLLAQYDYNFVTADLPDIVFTTIPIPSPNFAYAPVAGTYVYSITAELSAAASGSILTPSANQGAFSVIEFA
jgi:hypothetical protein